MESENPIKINLSEDCDHCIAAEAHSQRASVWLKVLRGAAIGTAGGVIGLIGLSFLPAAGLAAIALTALAGSIVAGLTYNVLKSEKSSSIDLVNQKKSYTMEAAQAAPITTIVRAPQTLYAESETYHRDRVVAAARQALLSMDHTKMSPQ